MLPIWTIQQLISGSSERICQISVAAEAHLSLLEPTRQEFQKQLCFVNMKAMPCRVEVLERKCSNASVKQPELCCYMTAQNLRSPLSLKCFDQRSDCKAFYRPCRFVCTAWKASCLKVEFRIITNVNFVFLVFTVLETLCRPQAPWLDDNYCTIPSTHGF